MATRELEVQERMVEASLLMENGEACVQGQQIVFQLSSMQKHTMMFEDVSGRPESKGRGRQETGRL